MVNSAKDGAEFELYMLTCTVCPRSQTTWLRTLLSQGLDPTTSDLIIPSTIIDATITPRVASRSNATDPETTLPYYGLAQSMYDYRGHRVIEHGGDVPGQKSQVIRLPDRMFGVAIMVNDEQLGDMYHQVAKWRIIDHLLGLAPVDFKTRSVTVARLLPPISAHNVLTLLIEKSARCSKILLLDLESPDRTTLALRLTVSIPYRGPTLILRMARSTFVPFGMTSDSTHGTGLFPVTVTPLDPTSSQTSTKCGRSSSSSPTMTAMHSM